MPGHDDMTQGPACSAPAMDSMPQSDTTAKLGSPVHLPGNSTEDEMNHSAENSFKTNDNS